MLVRLAVAQAQALVVLDPVGGLVGLVDAILDGVPQDVIADLTATTGAPPGDVYRVGDSGYARVATEVTEQLVDRWADRLGGVAALAHTNAVTAIDTVRFDDDLDGGASSPALDRPA